MLSDLLAYSGIVTKVKAMESHLLRPADYEKIAALNGVADFVLFLKGTPGYKDLFAGFDEHSLHRSQIESLLTNSLYRDYSKLFCFAGKEQRNALKLVYFRYEVNIIKTCMKQAFDNSSQLDLSTFEPFFSRHSRLDLNRLSKASALEEVVNELKGSEYELPLRSLSGSEALTLRDCELTLDIYYYIKAWKMCRTLLKGKEQKAFQDILGKQIDLLNLMWIYRSKKYYDTDPVTIYASLIPIRYKLTKNQITAMTEAASLEEFFTQLHSTPYAAPSQKGETFLIEAFYNQLTDKAYLDSKRRNPASISTLFYYLYLKEQEIDRLTTALECIRYQLEPSKALNYILE